MILRSNLKEAARSLHATKQRTLLTLIGIVIGIGSVIAMISVGTIVKLEALKQFQELGTEILNIRKLRGGPAAIIRLHDAVGLPAATASIEAAAPWLRGRADLVYAGKSIGGDRGEVLGVTAPFADLNRLRLSDGRFISDLDVRRYYCVIGADVAAAMRRAGAKQLIGESLRVAERLYTVVGVLHSSARGRRPFRPNRAAFVPITTAQRAFDKAEIQRVVARMKPDVHHAVAVKEVQDYFRRQSRGLRVAVESAKQLIEHMQKQMQLFALLLGAVGSISLIVGGVGVMNVMLVSVSERRKEIGIRRALGAQRRTIQSQFLIESVILSLLGGVFGVGLGVGASYVICQFTGWSFLVSPAAMVLGVGVASGVGIFFGFYPAYQAARLDPIAALRSE